MLPPLNPSFPGMLALLVFTGLAALLTLLSARLVTQAAGAVEPVERQAGFVRVASGVGSLAWAIDLCGLVILAPFDLAQARLWPALLGLCILLVSARFCIPALASTRLRRSVVLAGVGLATGYIANHLALLSAFGITSATTRWAPVLAAWGICAMMITILSLRARERRLQQDEARARLRPGEILFGGLAILAQQLLLADAIPPLAGDGGDTQLPLLVLSLFAVLICAEQFFSQGIEATRQRLFTRALDRPRAHTGQDHRRLALIAERIDSLLQADRLRLHFQPITPLSGPPTGLRFEALLRLHDDTLGRIDPEQFLLACERSHRTGRADRAILVEALRCSMQWRDSSLPCSGISVNVSHETLLESDFLPWLQSQLTRGNWPAGWLQLEITEHAMILHAERLAGVLRTLKDMGVGTVMDDFGAGFSSLGSLVDLPIQGIKCDKALVRALSGDPARQTLLQHLCALAHELGLSITVEGVETQADLGIVRAKGAAKVQGYVFARPMPHEEVLYWLRDGAAQPA